MREISVIDWGICDYKIALNRQKQVWLKRVKDEIPDTLILMEHPPVFTLGKSGKPENLLVSDAFLKTKNISVYRVERGGDITFHGPGQIVGYPIFTLKEPLIGIRKFIYQIEKAIQLTLQEFDISAHTRHPQIGVWVADAKIASIGIAVSRGVSFHGFALNVTTDLSYFEYINPCGMKKLKMTSLAEVLHQKISIAEVKEKIKNSFLETFNLCH